MTNFNEVKLQTEMLIEQNAKPSELYAFFRSFDNEKETVTDVMLFNKKCGFTSQYKDLMNHGVNAPEWL